MKQEEFCSYIERICNQTAWSEWQPLKDCWLGNRLPKTSGIYAIRLAGAQDLVYIGETGRETEDPKKRMNLKKRMAMLKQVYDEKKMPYRSPHTAGPHLWTLRKITTTPLEVSIIPFGNDEDLAHDEASEHAPTSSQTPPDIEPIGEESEQNEIEEEIARKGLEYLAIALHRQQFGRSPAAQVGRMPIGWRSSSSNNARLAALGLRYRGGRTTVLDESHVPGVPPVVALSLAGDPMSLQWGGHDWSTWCHASKMQPPEDAEGLYRLSSNDELLYIGRGQIADRLKEYKKSDVACSWVEGPWIYHQQLELIYDLVASYLLSCKALPSAQFGLSKQARKARMNQPVSPERAWWMKLLEELWQERVVLTQQAELMAS